MAESLRSAHSAEACSRDNGAAPQRARPVEVRISTDEYKITPLKKAAREPLGCPHPRRVPRGVCAEQAIGISTDEFTRAKDSGLRFPRTVFPLVLVALGPLSGSADAAGLRRRWPGLEIASHTIVCTLTLELTVAMADYIDNFYNLHRRHSYLGQISPSEYETFWHKVQSSPQLP